MPASNSKAAQNGLTPCRLRIGDWPKCTEDNCYLNYRCPIYRGIYPSPVRDYIPLPPVFIRVTPFEAVPFFYRTEVPDIDDES